MLEEKLIDLVKQKVFFLFKIFEQFNKKTCQDLVSCHDNKNLMIYIFNKSFCIKLTTNNFLKMSYTLSSQTKG